MWGRLPGWGGGEEEDGDWTGEMEVERGKSDGRGHRGDGGSAHRRGRGWEGWKVQREVEEEGQENAQGV